MATFAERFKELRKEKGLTQSDLANMFFISKSAISKYENGVNVPENKLLQDMFNTLFYIIPSLTLHTRYTFITHKKRLSFLSL